MKKNTLLLLTITSLLIVHLNLYSQKGGKKELSSLNQRFGSLTRPTTLDGRFRRLTKRRLAGGVSKVTEKKSAAVGGISAVLIKAFHQQRKKDGWLEGPQASWTKMTSRFVSTSEDVHIQLCELTSGVLCLQTEVTAQLEEFRDSKGTSTELERTGLRHELIKAVNKARRRRFQMDRRVALVDPWTKVEGLLAHYLGPNHRSVQFKTFVTPEQFEELKPQS